MQFNCRTASSRTFLCGILTAAFVIFTCTATTAFAQQSKSSPCGDPATQTLKTFDLANASQQNDANEILVAVRNMLSPCVRVILVASQNKIVLESSPEQIALAEKIVQELDRPKKSYRLTFTVTDFDGTNKTGTRHYALIVASGQRVTMKQGRKVPIITGKYDKGSSGTETQNTYLDVGMNFDATVNPYVGGLELRSKIEQSSVGETSEIGPHDPVIHQAVIEGVSTLALGKPSVLGALDVPDSTKRMEISILAEVLP